MKEKIEEKVVKRIIKVLINSRFGKEYELTNEATILTETRNKNYDGSGPFEIKTKVLKYYEAAVFEQFLTRIFTHRVLFDYFYRDDSETQEKGNHFHFSIRDNRDLEDLVAISMCILLNTPLKKLLTLHRNFRNSLTRWNNKFLNVTSYREYTAITRNSRNSNLEHYELRVSEGALTLDLIFYTISVIFTLLLEEDLKRHKDILINYFTDKQFDNSFTGAIENLEEISERINKKTNLYKILTNLYSNLQKNKTIKTTMRTILNYFNINMVKLKEKIINYGDENDENNEELYVRIALFNLLNTFEEYYLKGFTRDELMFRINNQIIDSLRVKNKWRKVEKIVKLKLIDMLL